MNELAVIDESRELHTHTETELDEFARLRLTGSCSGSTCSMFRIY
jgi:hypothetical protein